MGRDFWRFVEAARPVAAVASVAPPASLRTPAMIMTIGPRMKRGFAADFRNRRQPGVVDFHLAEGVVVIVVGEPRPGGKRQVGMTHRDALQAVDESVAVNSWESYVEEPR